MNDSEHVQPGEYYAKKNKVDYHLPGAGCTLTLVARYLEPLVKKLIADNRLGDWGADQLIAEAGLHCKRVGFRRAEGKEKGKGVVVRQGLKEAKSKL